MSTSAYLKELFRVRKPLAGDKVVTELIQRFTTFLACLADHAREEDGKAEGGALNDSVTETAELGPETSEREGGCTALNEVYADDRSLSGPKKGPLWS